METHLADFIRDTEAGQEADSILRKCVHCGFCTATCPTYQLLGDELDGPRGRIYLIKEVLEGATVTDSTRLHLDRCLTCLNCETTCPSGVKYGRLVEIGRTVVEERVATARPLPERMLHWALRAGLTRPRLFGLALGLGRMAKPLLPRVLAAQIPDQQPVPSRPTTRHARTMLLLDGCVQPALSPEINAATERVFDALGISLTIAPKVACCGAIRQHLHDGEGAQAEMRRNVDAWWPLLEAGAEAIVMTASGCGMQVKQYGTYLRDDPAYAARATAVSLATKDLSEILHACKDELRALLAPFVASRIAFHPPCTLQHGQKIRGLVEDLLGGNGAEVETCQDSHLCCGSAGTYSILQSELSGRLREDKLQKLAALEPDVIASANIGCLHHLQAGTSTPVRHWIELIAAALPSASSEF